MKHYIIFKIKSFYYYYKSFQNHKVELIWQRKRNLPFIMTRLLKNMNYYIQSHNNDPSIIGLCNHLEIIGKKRVPKRTMMQ